MKTLVLGTGLSGYAALRLLRHTGEEFRLFDESGKTSVDGVAVAGPVWEPSILDDVDRVVASPGFAEHSKPISDALERGIPVVSEPELAFGHLSMPVVAVTGTNGKTTVTRLIHEMCVVSGHRSVAAGNIGLPLSDIIEDDYDVAIVELSSFQLRFIRRFRPRVSVIVNIAEDHLDWHTDRESYVAAKARIVENQTFHDRVVFNADEPTVVEIAAGSSARQTAVSTLNPNTEYAIRNGALWFGSFAVPTSELRVSGDAFFMDLLLAGAAALAAGASSEAVESVVRAFVPGTHRRTLVGTSGGVAFVNDSKATNPHAAVAAIGSFPSVVLIAGGLAKGLDLSPLVSHPHVRHVFAIGEASAALVAADSSRVTAASDLEEAIREAAAMATKGDTVLLAPGCASFDMFASYKARGDAFTAIVAKLLKQRNAS